MRLLAATFGLLLALAPHPPRHGPCALPWPPSPRPRTHSNTPVFLEFQNGHWLSLYGCQWPKGELPPLELRTMTGDLPDASSLAGDVPNSRRHTLRFYARMLGTWIAMGFKSPKITVYNGEIHA